MMSAVFKRAEPDAGRVCPDTAATVGRAAPGRPDAGPPLYKYPCESARVATISCRVLFFFLAPRRRSGERTEERGIPDPSPRPSPPSDGGEGVFGWVFAALSGIRPL